MTMASTNRNTKRVSLQERDRSKEYLNRARLLLELAEQELISMDGHLISVDGLKKLRKKVDLFEQA